MMEEVCKICYMRAEDRSPRTILRLHNLTFKVGIITRSLFGKTPKTKAHIYGIYFHNITSHLSCTYRLIALSSINAEQQERTFGDVRRFASCSSMKTESILNNVMLRFDARKKSNWMQTNYAAKQPGSISKLSQQLEPASNTTFKYNFMSAHPRLMQVHFERIADYIVCGCDVWYTFDDDCVNA